MSNYTKYLGFQMHFQPISFTHTTQIWLTIFVWHTQHKFRSTNCLTIFAMSNILHWYLYRSLAGSLSNYKIGRWRNSQFPMSQLSKIIFQLQTILRFVAPPVNERYLHGIHWKNLTGEIPHQIIFKWKEQAKQNQ
jgi:hypothetical protein